MFGHYDIPFHVTKGPVSVSVERDGERLIYRRECHDEKVEKLLLAQEGRVAINPVEPVARPKEITSLLLVEFEKPISIEPRGKGRLLLAFPVEIGVFLPNATGYDVLDIFSLTKQKFTLYGDPKNGVICKHWRSGLYHSRPSLDPLRAGVMELVITNGSGIWIEVTRTVYNGRAMKIFYKEDLVSASAVLKIASAQVAETDFAETPLEEGMQKSIGLYSQQRLAVIAGKFVMEWGM